MTKKKILYLMHVDWECLKQRPQFIAEGLAKFYEIQVFFHISYLTKFKKIIKITKISKKRSNLFLNSIPYLPLYLRIRLIYNLNKLIWRIYFRFYLKKYNPHYIWITFPSLYDYIPTNTKSKIIYDCMDDTLSFDPRFYEKDKLLNSEKELIKNASIVYVSANNLADKLDQREKCRDKIVLNRNAFDGVIFPNNNDYINNEKQIYKIGYVGSISSWFDFESLYYTLDNIKNIEYHLIGPIDSLARFR